MSKVKIHNLARGARGGFIGEESFEIGPGSARTFDEVSEADLKALVAKDYYRVQTFEGGNWVDQSNTAIPNEKPWIAIASGAKGERMRVIPLEDGECFVGMVRASDQPESVAGYEWTLIGGVSEVVVSVADYRAPMSVIQTGGGTAFDPKIYVADLMPDVIAGLADMDVDKLDRVKAAELASEKPRKGVLNAIEAREKELSDDPFEG